MDVLFFESCSEVYLAILQVWPQLRTSESVQQAAKSITSKKDKEDWTVITVRSSSLMLLMSCSVILVATTGALVQVVVGGVRNKQPAADTASNILCFKLKRVCLHFACSFQCGNDHSTGRGFRIHQSISNRNRPFIEQAFSRAEHYGKDFEPKFIHKIILQ